VINNPIDAFFDSERRNFKCYAKIQHPPNIEEPFLMVIYKKTNNNIKVITAMWRTKGGIQANGFNKI